MQAVSAAFLAAIRGSHRPRVRVDAWYGGELVAADLPVAAGGTLNLDAGRTVQGQITGLRVVDPDGRFEPRSETAALAPYGSRLHVTGWVDGLGDVLSLGWYRITRSATTSRWGWYDTPRPATTAGATGTFGVTYAFTSKSVTPTSTTGDATGGPVTSNNLAGFEVYTSGYPTKPVLRVNTASTTATSGISNGRYYTFTVTPPPGVTSWQPQVLTFKAARSGSSTPRGVAVRSSKDGYAANLYSADITSERPQWMGVTVSLTGMGSVTGPLTFRFYPYAPASTSDVDFDDFQVTGQFSTVVVTESAEADRRWVQRGGVVDVDGDDGMWQVDAERFLAPESPASTTSCVGEIRRLLSGIVPLGDTTGVVDRSIPASVVYDDSRSDAVKALADAVGAVPRMSPHGLLDLVPVTPGPPVWTIDVAPDKDTPGALVSAGTVLSADDLPNAARSSGTDPVTNLPIVGLAFEGGNALKFGQMTEGGALRFGGPHGRIPVFHDSPLITTQAQANADALTTLQTTQASRSQTLEVTCIPNPALQLFDTVTIRTPAGSLDGQVRQITYPLSPGPMTLQVLVPRVNYLALWSRL